jgi:hypothetical protein
VGVLTWRMTSAKLIASSMPGIDPARSAKKEPSSSPAASLAFSGLGSTSCVHNQAILSTPQTSFSSENVSQKRQSKALKSKLLMRGRNALPAQQDHGAVGAPGAAL